MKMFQCLLEYGVDHEPSHAMPVEAKKGQGMHSSYIFKISYHLVSGIKDI